MKKNYLFGLLSLFTLLFAASCQEEELAGAQYGDTATVTFQVGTPTIATRAVGDGTTATKLYVAVYENQNDALAGPLEASLINEDEAVTVTNCVATVNLSLAKNKEYSVIFWAETSDATDAIFSIDWEKRQLSLKVDSLKANQESYDAFWAQKTVKLTGALTESVDLKRPFAQLNIGTGDKSAAEDAGIVVSQSQVTVKDVPTTFDLQNGEVGNDTTVTYRMADIASIKDERFPTADTAQHYLSLNYLPMAVDKTIVDIEFQYKDEQDDAAYVLNFPSVPVQRNYRTNIYGTLLTNSANYTVEIKPGFGNDGEEDAANIIYVTTDEELEAALRANDENIIIYLMPTKQMATTRAAGATEYTVDISAWVDEYYFGGEATDSITIHGNGCILNFKQKNTDWNYIRCVNPDAKWILNDLHLTNSGANNGPWNRHDIRFYNAVELNNVTSDKAIALLNDGKLTDVTIADLRAESDDYGLWITAQGQTVVLDGCTFNMIKEGEKTGRGIKIADEYVDEPALVNLTVKNTKFNTEAKAAILVTSTAGAKITLEEVDLSGVKADGFNAVWVDEDRKESADKVEVIGGFCVIEGTQAENNPFLVEGNTVKVAKGVYSSLPKVADGVTIEAEEGTVFTGTSRVSGKNVTIKNVTFTNTDEVVDGEYRALTGNLTGTVFENCHFDAKHGARYCYAYGDVVFNDCTFGDENCTRGVHFDDGNGTVTFNRCTIYGFTALGGGVEKMIFNECQFPYNNRNNVVNMYSVYEFNDCKFNPSMYTDCAADNVVASYTNCSYTDGKSIYSLVRFDKDPATCTITFDGKQLTSSSAQLASAVAAMEGTEATFLLAKGTFALPGTLTGKTLVLEGADKEATIIDMTHGGTPQYGAQSVTFKNLTMKRQAEWIGGFSHSGAEHYEDCIVEGTLVTYCPTVTATRTNFVPAAKEYYNVHLYSPGQMTFTDCNFSTTRGRSIYAHHDENVSEYRIVFSGCNFTTGEMAADDSQNQAAIRLHTEYGIHGTLTINNCTATGWKADHNGGLWVEWNNGSKAYTNNFVKLIDGQSPVFAITVTPENIASMNFNQSETFKLVGDFSEVAGVKFDPTEGVNAIIDASQATFGNRFTFSIPQTPDNEVEVSRANGRKGNYTLTGFNNTVLSLGAYGTSIAVEKSTLKVLDVYAANISLDVHGNTIDCGNESHLSYSSSGTTDYAANLMMIAYDLKFDGNKLSNAKSHVVGINGSLGIFDKNYSKLDDPDWQSNIDSFTGNTMSGIGINTDKDNRAGLKIWDDLTYAPKNVGSYGELPEAGKELIAEVEATKANNIFIKADTPKKAYKTCLYEITHSEL